MAVAPKKYIDIIIDNGSYTVIETSKKPRSRGAAAATLKKIEAVLKDQLSYADNNDRYSALSPEDRSKALQNHALTIKNKFFAKSARVNPFDKIFFNISKKNRKIEQLFNRVENLIIPPTSIDLPFEVVCTYVGKYLHSSDIRSLALTNRQSNELAKRITINHARDFGYAGNDLRAARQFIHNFFHQIRYTFTNVFSQENIKNVHTETLLPIFKSLNSKDLFAIFTDYRSYHPEILQHLLKLRKLWAQIPVATENDQKLGVRALSQAAYLKSPEVMKTLLDHGADPNQHPELSKYPIFTAINKNFMEGVQLLLRHGAQVNTVDEFGNPPLVYASNAHAPNLDMIKLLLKHGADPNLHGVDSSCALSIAASKGRGDIIKLLIQHGAVVNERIQGGATALCYACCVVNNIEMIKFLLNHGADPNFATAERNTPLQLAAYRGFSDVVELLLQKGADINNRGQLGKTALHWAVDWGYVAVISVLLANGADRTLEDNRGRTAEYYANKSRNIDLIAAFNP